MLKFAKLLYGTSAYPVAPHEATPLPLEFDFENPTDCAKKIFAIMSHASGGHRLHECRVHISVANQTAHLVADGVVVYYAPEHGESPPLPENLEALKVRIIQELHNRVTLVLGSVVTNQYSEGWICAKWS